MVKTFFSFEQLKCLLISCTPGLYETQHCQVLPVWASCVPSELYLGSGPEYTTSHRVTKCSLTRAVSGDSSCNSHVQLLSAGQDTNAAADDKELSHLCAKSTYQHPVHLKEEKRPGQNSKTRPKVVWDKETSEIGFVTGREKKWRGLRGARRGRGGRKGWDWADSGQDGVLLSDLDGWGWDGEEIKPETRYHF